MIEMGQNMADALLKGGNIFVPDVHKYWASEFGGRAGGLMILQGKPESAKDIAYFPLPKPGNWDPETDESFQKLLKAKAKLFIIGDSKELGKYSKSPRIAGSTGSLDPDAGMKMSVQFLAHLMLLAFIVLANVGTLMGRASNAGNASKEEA